MTLAYDLNIYADKDAWLAGRERGVGSSEAAAIMGVSPWQSPYSIWAKKRGLAELEVGDANAANWGNLLEPVVANAYSEATQATLLDRGRWAVMRSKEVPSMTASLDREIVSFPTRAGPGVLECKTTRFCDDWTERPPLHYQIQLQHQLAVTGYGWGALAVLIGGSDFRTWETERDETLIEQIREACRKFWQRVENGEPPPVDGSDATREALKLQPRTATAAAILPPEAADWFGDIESAKLAEKSAKSLRQEAENHLIAALGIAEAGVLPGALGTVSYKMQSRAAYMAKASEFRVLRFGGVK